MTADCKVPLRSVAASTIPMTEKLCLAMTLPTIRSHILYAVGVLTLVILLALLLVRLADVWLLSFGGVLLAVALHGAGAAFAKRTPLPTSAAVAIVCVLFFVLSGISLWSMGPGFIDNLMQLREELPAALESARSFVSSHPELSQLIESTSQKVSNMKPGAGLLGRLGDLFSTALGALSTIGGALVGIFVIGVIAIYAALSPQSYTGALLAAIPARHKERTQGVLSALAISLRWWLVGRLASMIVVGTLTWLGLLLLGVPSAGTLGALSALLSFVPNIGPIVSAIPAILLGLGQSPTMALYVIGLYALVQIVESYVVTPLIQQRVVALPPAIIIIVQLAFGTALGILGLLFATPLAVAVMVLIQMLWIEDGLDQEISLPGK